MLSRLKSGSFRTLRCLTGLVQNSPTPTSAIQPPCVASTASYSSGPSRPHSSTLDQKISSPDKRLNQFSTSPAVHLAEEEQDISKVVSEQITSQLRSNDEVGRLFAVVYVAGHQRKITSEDIIVLDQHIEADIGDRITLNKVLLVGSKDFTLIGRPVLSPSLVRVEATVLEKTLSYTRVRFRYLRRQNNRKMRLRKERYTYLRINSIDLSSSVEQEHSTTIST